MASEIVQLKNLLEQLVAAAEQKDKAAVRRLNSEFERTIPPLSNRSQQIIDYDNCRQSCVMAFTIPQMYGAYVQDARERFLKITGDKVPQ